MPILLAVPPGRDVQGRKAPSFVQWVVFRLTGTMVERGLRVDGWWLVAGEGIIMLRVGGCWVSCPRLLPPFFPPPPPQKQAGGHAFLVVRRRDDDKCASRLRIKGAGTPPMIQSQDNTGVDAGCGCKAITVRFAAQREASEAFDGPHYTCLPVTV